MISTNLIVFLKCIMYYTIILPIFIFLKKFNSFISLNLISNSHNNYSNLNSKNINFMLNEIPEFNQVNY